MANSQKLDGNFVKEKYNSFLRDYKKDYEYYRWQRTPLSRYQYKQSKRTLKRALKGVKVSRALEIGGGDGTWTKVFLPHVKNLDFFDISSEMIKRAKERLNGNIRFIQGDFMHSNLESESYELIVAFRVFEYFEDQDKAMEEFKRLLKPGGKCILVTKSPAYDWSEYYTDKTFHSGQRDIRKVRQMFVDVGLSPTMILPAIIGKGLKYGFLRFIFDLKHRFIMSTVKSLSWLGLFSRWSESFLISATKEDN